MLNKILTVAIFILVVWLSTAVLNINKNIKRISYQSILVQDQLQDLTSSNERLIFLLEDLKEVQIKNSQKKNSSSKGEGKTRPKKGGKPITFKKVIKNVKDKLFLVKKKLKDRKLADASALLNLVKKELWKERENKKTSKKSVLFVLSSIDSLLKKIKSNPIDASFSTKEIEERLVMLLGNQKASKGFKLDFSQLLSVIRKEIQDKDIEALSESLLQLKGKLWKIRDDKNISKNNILKTISLIDILKKQIKDKGKSGVYSTKDLEKSLSLLKVKK